MISYNFSYNIISYNCCSTDRMLICCDLPRSLLDTADILTLRPSGIDLLCKALKIYFIIFYSIFCFSITLTAYHVFYCKLKLLLHVDAKSIIIQHTNPFQHSERCKSEMIFLKFYTRV